MAKRSGMYSMNKRKKELKRQKKQEEKRQKRENVKADSQGPEETAAVNTEGEASTETQESSQGTEEPTDT